jgi:aflatoxin B1 aldehyde reductase
MAFYAYNPLAGGLLTGKHSSATLETAKDGRFRLGNELYRNRYLHPAQLGATDAFAAACKAEGIAPSHAALRWLRHHSALRAGTDAIVVGASRLEHLEENLCALEEGALPESIVRALDDGWVAIKSAGCVPSYERGTSKY